MLLAFIVSAVHYVEIVKNPETFFKVDPSGKSAHEHLKDIANNILNNILGVYLPIAAVMMTSFFSSTEEYRRQNISRGQAVAAIIVFAAIQMINLVFMTVFVFLSGDLEVANMPVIQNAALTSLLGVIVTFAFPEKKDLPATAASADTPRG